MKTKNQLVLGLLVTGLLVTGIVYGDDPVKGTKTDADTTAKTGLGWQEKTKSTPTLVCNGLNLSTGVSVNQNGINWTVGVNSTFEWVDCCKPATLIQSWCNFNADDPKCPD